MSKKIKRSYIREILDAIDENTISFAGGVPNDELFPIDKLSKCVNKISNKRAAYQYSSSFGLEKLREQIADIYTNRLNFPTTKDEILITTGSQQAIDLINKCNKDKDVIVQSPTYIGALSSFKVSNIKLKSFKHIDELDSILDNRTILYIMSDFQNPNTKSYCIKERNRILSSLEKSNSYLIEDGAYIFLNFKNTLNKQISSEYSNSYHLGSFSKILSPGLRVGWIRASETLINELIIPKESLDLHTSTFSQMLISEFINSYDLFEHIEKIKFDYQKKMQFMSSCLKKYIPSFKFKEPSGGMFIYGEFETDSMSIAKSALKKNVAIVPSEVFLLDAKSNEARLNFTNSSFYEIEKGVKILKECI